MVTKNKKDNNTIVSEFQRNLGKLLSNKLKIPVIHVDESKIKDFFGIIKKETEIKSKYSDDELYMEVSQFLKNMTVFPPKNTKESNIRAKSFIEYLKREKKYEAIILLSGLINLPVKTKIGCLEIIEKDNSKKELLDLVQRLEKEKRVPSRNYSWGKVIFRSYRTNRVEEILLKKLELSLGILSLLMKIDLDIRNVIGVIYGKDKKTMYFLQPPDEYLRGWSKYSENLYGKHMKHLSGISRKSTPTKLEKKILQAIQIFWLSRLYGFRAIWTELRHKLRDSLELVCMV